MWPRLKGFLHRSIINLTNFITVVWFGLRTLDTFKLNFPLFLHILPHIFCSELHTVGYHKFHYNMDVYKILYSVSNTSKYRFGLSYLYILLSLRTMQSIRNVGLVMKPIGLVMKPIEKDSDRDRFIYIQTWFMNFGMVLVWNIMIATFSSLSSWNWVYMTIAVIYIYISKWTKQVQMYVLPPHTCPHLH